SVSSSLFFSSRRRHTRATRDWSSDVCSSDLRSSSSAHHSGRPRQSVPASAGARPAAAASFSTGQTIPCQFLPTKKRLVRDALKRSEERRVGKAQVADIGDDDDKENEARAA